MKNFLSSLLKVDPSKNLESVLKRGNNNFDFIRLIAALLVIFGHSFALHPSNGAIEPFYFIIGFGSIGGFAVYIFFFISGMLITSSYFYSSSPARFITMRFFRIWPALFICIILAVFLIGPLVTSLGSTVYFQSPKTWAYLFFNSILIKLKYELPGVFDNNFLPHTVNGSIWTLPLEIKCYVGVLLMGLFGFVKNFKWFIAFILALTLSYFVYPSLLLTLAGSNGIQFWAFFGVGVIAFYLRKYIILDYKILLFLLVLWGIFRFSPFNPFAFNILLVYLVLMTSSSGILKKINLRGDYSYGVYIYGYLVQQVIAHYFPKIASLPSLLISIPVSFMLGFISWHLLEKHALNLGKFLSKIIENKLAVMLKKQKEAAINAD